MFDAVVVVDCTLSKIWAISADIKLWGTWRWTLWWFEDTTLVPVDKSSGNCANSSAFMGGGASVVYVGKVMPNEVSTATDASTNEDLRRDSGSLLEATVVVFANGPWRLSLCSPRWILLGLCVACKPTSCRIERVDWSWWAWKEWRDGYHVTPWCSDWSSDRVWTVHSWRNRIGYLEAS